jgi:hypothetical protein
MCEETLFHERKRKRWREKTSLVGVDGIADGLLSLNLDEAGPHGRHFREHAFVRSFD